MREKAEQQRRAIRRDLRAAAIGGLAATFVVAAAFAPKLLGSSDEVRVRNSSTPAFAESTTTTVTPAASAGGDTSTPTQHVPPSTGTGGTDEPEKSVASPPTTVASTSTSSTSTSTTATSTTTTTTPPALETPVLSIDTVNGTISWEPIPDATSYRFSFDHSEPQDTSCCTVRMPAVAGGWRLPWTEIWALGDNNAQSPRALLKGTGDPEGANYHCDPNTGRCVALPS